MKRVKSMIKVMMLIAMIAISVKVVKMMFMRMEKAVTSSEQA